MSSWANDLISTPAASRGGTAQTTPRAASKGALKKSNVVLPAVAAALKKKEGGISFLVPGGEVFDPNSTRALAARHAKSTIKVGVDKIISVKGDDVTHERRQNPKAHRRRTGTGGCSEFAGVYIHCTFIWQG